MAKRKLTHQQKLRIAKTQAQQVSRLARSSDDAGPARQGLVVAHHGTSVSIKDLTDKSTRQRYHCHLRANLEPLVVGDQVVWQPNGRQSGVVSAGLPRRSLLAQTNERGQTKAIAANIDQMLIVFAVVPEPIPYLIDCYLAAAELNHIAPLLVVNKQDLLTTQNNSPFSELINLYQHIGYPLLLVSSKTGYGLTPLKQQLIGQVSILAGQSGVGKTSLANQLLPASQLAVGPLSTTSQLGTHTTSTARLLDLPTGGSLIDSPGIREFRLGPVDSQQAINGFKELAPYQGQCKFRDCRHQREPGCALQAALAAGKVNQQRLTSLTKMMSH
jgi:ribosome biogenesis GTPase